MGARGKLKNIEVHSGSIRICFRIDGKLHRKTLGLPPTKANLDYATRLAADIRERIKRGGFSWDHYWPEDAKPDVSEGPPTFLAIARQYLASVEYRAPSTVQGYRQSLNRYFLPWLGDLPISEITYGQLAALVAENLGALSLKTRNNALTPLRGVFDLAFADGHIPTNPALRLKFAKIQREPPDPFTTEERELILSWFAKDRPEWLTYFEVAFFTGLRSSELIGLQWGDIDFRRGLVRVQRARVRHQMKITKTGQVRDVELNSRAMAALQRQRAVTQLHSEWVFLQPTTGQQILDDRPPRRVFTLCLRALGIRHRKPYATRHTYATACLGAGVKPAWIAAQLGHSVDMLFKHYARWIQDDDKGRELAKVESALGGTLGNPGEYGGVTKSG
jgi:integrase